MKLPYPDGLKEGAAQFGIELKSHATIDPTSGFRRWARFHGESIFGQEARTADFLGGSKKPIVMNVKAPPLTMSSAKLIPMQPVIKTQPLAKKAPTVAELKKKNTTAKVLSEPLKIDTAAARAGLGLAPVNSTYIPQPMPGGVGGKGTYPVTSGTRSTYIPEALPSFAVPGTAKLPPPAAAAALASADRLLSDPNVTNAAEVIDNTKALAALGDSNAQRGASVIEAVANARQDAGTPPGQPLIPVTTPEQLAMVEAAIPMTVQFTPISDVQQMVADKKNESWFARFLSLFGLALRKD